MSASSQSLLRHIHRLAARKSVESSSDATLLERFVAQRDETAFAVLLARHGPMVLGVCRRVLGDSSDAEDVFQAAFLILAQKAATLRHPEALSSWLYGTARHLALKCRREAARRHQRESECARITPSSSTNDPLQEVSARELLVVLDEELMRLPESYRLPLILCGLEGRTQEEAARLLGCTAGSLRGRLQRGRARLHARLSRRGLTLSATVLTLSISQTGAASTAARLSSATLQAALTFARGERGGIAATVLALAESAITSVTMTKAKVGLMLLLAIGLAAGTGVLAYPQRTEKQPEATRTAAKTQDRKSETPKRAADKPAPTDLYGDPLPSGAIARLGTVRFRHDGSLRDVLVSPDGRTLISAGYQGVEYSVELWDVQTGCRRRRIAFSFRSVPSIDLSPDGKLLAIGRLSHKMRFWNPDTGAEVHPFGENAPEAWLVAFSPNGKLLATLDAQNPPRINIWDIRGRKKIRTMEGGKKWMFRPLVFSPNSEMLAFPSDNSGVRVWDVATGKELYWLDLSAKTRLGCVVFSSDGKLLAAASDPYENSQDYAIHLWDTATGKEVGALKGHEDGITALAMSPKSNVLSSASRDGTIRFWDLAKRRETSRHRTSIWSLSALAFTPDGRVLISGENNGRIRRWPVSEGEDIRTAAERANALNWVAFAPDGETLISIGDDRIGLWEPFTGRPRRLLDAKLPKTFYPILSPDGKMLAMVDWMQGQIHLRNVATGKLIRRLGEDSHPGRITSCVFSADGRRVAGGSYEQDIIRVWDAANGKELHQLKGQNKSRSLAFSPDGVTLASASVEANGDYTVRLWKLATGKEIWRKTTRPWTAFDLTFSPDGRTLALVGGMPGRLNETGEVHLWEAASGKELRHFEGHRERVGRVAFSTDGRMLATGSQDNTIRLWEVATGKERQCFQGHQNGILAVSFSPDGRLLVSASRDTTALVWDLTGRFRDGRFQPRHLSAEELNRCWTDLLHADAARAYRSILALTGSPNETIPFLKQHLLPVTAADPKSVAPLLAALDSDRFAERDKAMTELEKLDLAVEPALRRALNTKPSLEVRHRIETILDKLAGGSRLRFLRALEVLEHIATPEAKQILATLSQGTAEMWPTQEAKASLERLAARPLIRP